MEDERGVERCRECGVKAVLTWAKMNYSDCDGWRCPVCGRTWAGQ